MVFFPSDEPVHKDAAFQPPQDADRILEVLKAAAAPLTGDEFLHNLVQQLGELFDAETTFVARRLDREGSLVKGLAAWKDGQRKEAWEFDAAGNPCHLVYKGDPILIPCDVASRFDKKRDSGYQSFVGYPLKGPGGEVVGHIGVYSSKEIVEDRAWLEICSHFAARAEAEINRAQWEDDRTRTIDALRDLDRVKNEFLSVAAHDLRGPLGVVRGLAEVMAQAPLAEDQRADALKTIIGASDRMLDLVNQYLNVTAVESGALVIDRAPLDLIPLIEDRVEFRRFIANDRDVTVKVEVPDGPVEISADERKFGQAFDNVLDNAIKYSPDGGVIAVSLKVVDDAAEITIDDQGPGVPAELHVRIFNPFETSGDDGGGKLGKSFGLGLMIAGKVVDAHGGTVFADDAPGGGARFVIRMPLGG